METIDGVEVLICEDETQWEEWLAAHHGDRPAAWLKIAKKGAGATTLSIKEAGDLALCYGWIDSQRRALDDRYYLQRYSPRRPRTAWSRVNVDRVAALTAAGRMRAPGLTEVAAAQADGRWESAYASQATAEVPPDLAAALESDPRASRAFEARGRTDRYALILRLLKARTPAARAAQLAKALAELREDSPET
ncbi:MAG: OmdA domain containing protein [Hamadaea sp.]|nr:OmdA domain containing protein [Hamadaea sp.]